MVTLPKPLLSPNLIYEDRRDVKQVVSHVIAEDANVNLVANTIHLKRGKVKVSAVNHCRCGPFQFTNPGYATSVNQRD